MTKTLRKAIMKRSQLKSKHFKTNTTESLRLYKKQNNFCSKLYKKERNTYYSSSKLNKVTDNKAFWKTIKPFLSDKGTNINKITLVHNDKVISDDKQLCKTFSDFFQETVKTLVAVLIFLIILIEIILIRNYENHPSVKKIRETITITSTFHLSGVDKANVEKSIGNLNFSKVGTFKSILTKCLKVTSDICSPFLAAIFNQELILNEKFAQKLKLADITPVCKKEDSTKVTNQRAVSVLPTISKISERLMQKQISEYSNQFLSPFLCGYRKGFSNQTALVWLIENGNISLIRTVNHSTAFVTINYDLLIAKLHAYGFGKNALDLVYSYLKNRKQRVKINTTFSTWTDLISGVPQGSVLGSLLFNIYLNDLFFFLQDVNIYNFADDTTLFVCDETLEIVLDKLEGNSELAIFWFENSYMKLTTDKCHLLVSGTKYEHSLAKIGDDKL